MPICSCANNPWSVRPDKLDGFPSTGTICAPVATPEEFWSDIPDADNTALVPSVAIAVTVFDP